MKKLLKVSFVGPTNNARIHWCALSLAYFAGVNSALTDKVKKKNVESQKRKKEKKKKRGKCKRHHFHLYPNATLVCRCLKSLGARLVAHFKQLFEHFKHIYTHFHLDIYRKNPNNIT